MPARVASSSPVRWVSRPRPVGAVGELARLLLGERDQLGQRLDLEPRRGGEEHRRAAEIADRHDVARHLDRQVVGRAGQGGEGRERERGERVAVRRRGRGGARRERAAGARLVDDHRLLAPHPREPVGGDAHDGVERAARRRVGDDAHRTGRVVLRRARRRRRRSPSRQSRAAARPRRRAGMFPPRFAPRSMSEGRARAAARGIF